MAITQECCVQSSTSPWRQHPTRHQLYGHLPPITKTIQVRRTRHAGHCWRSRDELIRDVLLWIPTHGRAKAGRPARTYIQQLCEDTGCCPEDLPRAMNDREEWRKRVRDIPCCQHDMMMMMIILQKNPGNLRRLAVTQPPGRNHQLKLIRKDNNNDNNNNNKWLRKGNVNTLTKYLLIAAQENDITTNDVKAKIDKTQRIASVTYAVIEMKQLIT